MRNTYFLFFLLIFSFFFSNEMFSNNYIEIIYIPRSDSDKKAQISLCVTKNTKVDWGDGYSTLISPKQSSDNTFLSQEIIHEYVEFGQFRQRIESQNLLKLTLADNIWSDNIGIQDSLLLGNCPMLEELIAFQLREVDSLDFSLCPNLKTLILRYSLIKNVNLLNNPNLEYLDLSQTNLLSIDLKKCTSIKTLLLNRTKIKDLDLTNNPNIEKLYTYDCDIKMLDIKNIPGIRRIWSEKTTEIIFPPNQYIKYELGKSIDYRIQQFQWYN